MVLALVSTVLFFLAGIALVFGAYLLPKEFGFASWRRQVALDIGCALLAVSMMPLGIAIGRLDAHECSDHSMRAPQAGDPSLPTADPIAPGEYIVFATVAMDSNSPTDYSCLAVVAPVYGIEVDADAMRIHALTNDAVCFVADVLGERWRLRSVPRSGGTTEYIAILPDDACGQTSDAPACTDELDEVEDAGPLPGSSSL